MIKTAQTLYEFFSQFNIPAYPENGVPGNAETPYLTYSLIDPDWKQQHTFYVQVYYRHPNSYYPALAKADEIVGAIGEGARLHFDDGLLVLRPENPLIQTKKPDGNIRAAYISLSINAYHMPGV